MKHEGQYNGNQKINLLFKFSPAISRFFFRRNKLLISNSEGEIRTNNHRSQAKKICWILMTSPVILDFNIISVKIFTRVSDLWWIIFHQWLFQLFSHSWSGFITSDYFSRLFFWKIIKDCARRLMRPRDPVMLFEYLPLCYKSYKLLDYYSSIRKIPCNFTEK